MIPIAFLQPESVQRKRARITFDAPPTNVSIKRANLRYDKVFAFCFNQDDGWDSTIVTVYPAFTGGTPRFRDTTSGSNGGSDSSAVPQYFTDGCGNDILWTSEINLNISGMPLVTNDNARMSEASVRELQAGGWVLGNHSYDNEIRGDGMFDLPDNRLDECWASGVNLARCWASGRLTQMCSTPLAALFRLVRSPTPLAALFRLVGPLKALKGYFKDILRIFFNF